MLENFLQSNGKKLESTAEIMAQNKKVFAKLVNMFFLFHWDQDRAQTHAILLLALIFFYSFFFKEVIFYKPLILLMFIFAWFILFRVFVCQLLGFL